MIATELDVASLSARLETLERQNRRIKAGGAVLALVCAASLLVAGAAPPPAKQITAQKFVLANRKGKALAVLGADTAGHPSLTLLGADGKPRATVGLGAQDLPSVALRDASGSSKASLQLGAAGRPSVQLSDASKRSVSLGVRADASVGMSVVGTAGTGLIDLSLSNAGAIGRLYITNNSVLNQDDEPVAPVGGVELGTSGFDKAFLQMSPPVFDAKTELRLGASKDGFSGLQILDAAGLKAHQLGIDPATVGLVDIAYVSDFQFVIDDADLGTGHYELGPMIWLPGTELPSEDADYFSLVSATQFSTRTPISVR